MGCDTEAFMIRGLCSTCAPTVHAEWEEGLAAFKAMDEMFWLERGHHALEDWYGFEGFITEQIDAMDEPRLL